MFATLGGSLALLLGLVVLLVPLLTPELSRARDAVWGAVLLLLGLVLLTSADRLGGSPMVAVLCGGLLIGRLGSEVGQQRWRALTPEEQQRLGSSAHWRTALGQVLASLGALQGMASQSLSGLLANLPQAAASTTTAFKGKAKGKAGGQSKRWVRPEPSATANTEATPQANTPASDPAVTESGALASPEPSPDRGTNARDEADVDSELDLDEPTPQPHADLSKSDSSIATAPPAADSPELPKTPVIEVSSFTEIEALVDAAWGEAPHPAQATGEQAPLGAREPTLAAEASPTSPVPPQESTDGDSTADRNEAG